MDTPKDRAHQKLVTVYTASNEAEGRMVQEVLENAGIKSTINAEMAPGIYPLSLGPWAPQDIQVLESAAAEASRILSELPERDQTDSGFEE